MSEYKYPKVLLDDDFIDLRNAQPEKSTERSSINLKKKNSESIRSRETNRPEKELQRFNINNRKSTKNLRVEIVNPKKLSKVCNRFEKKNEEEKSENRNRSNRDIKVDDESEDETSSNNSEDEKIMKNESIKKPQKDIFKKILSSANENIKKTKIPDKIQENTKIFTDKFDEETENEISSPPLEEKNDEMAPNLDLDENKDIPPSQNIGRENMKTKIAKNLETLESYNTTLDIIRNLRVLPSFKRSWTIPSLPLDLMKRDFVWTRHHNIFAKKVDRNTYEFDEEIDSDDSMENLNTSQNIIYKNFLNFVFCMGCLCGICLIAGILTVSEKQMESLKFSEEKDLDDGVLEIISKQISLLVQTIYKTLYSTLTLPCKKFSIK